MIVISSGIGITCLVLMPVIEKPGHCACNLAKNVPEILIFDRLSGIMMSQSVGHNGSVTMGTTTHDRPFVISKSICVWLLLFNFL